MNLIFQWTGELDFSVPNYGMTSNEVFQLNSPKKKKKKSYLELKRDISLEKNALPFVASLENSAKLKEGCFTFSNPAVRD